MPDLALVHPDGRVQSGEEIARPVRDRIKQAREHRKQFEPTWQLNLAYAAGQHWTTYDRDSRTLRRIQDVDPAYADRELYCADIINEYRMLALGELGSNDDRLQLLLQEGRDDQASEDYQSQVNRALGYGWDYEWDGDEALAESDRLCVDLGTSAMRCRFDPSFGPVKAESVPYQNGKPILNSEEAHAQVMAAAQAGQTLEFKPIQQGRITWEPISAFGLLVPPGVVHEKYFPWEGVDRPVLLSDVLEEFGEVAQGLEEDRDIGSTLGRTADTSTDVTAYALGEGRQTRLRDHVRLVTYYEKPTPKHRQGRVLHFAGGELRLLRVEDKLPYARLDENGEPVEWFSGLVFFHWWRVTGRFWSRSLVEALKDQQWMLNKNGTQINEWIDAAMPYVLVPEGPQEQDLKKTRRPMEVVKYTPGQSPPQPVPGVGPGAWMDQFRNRLLEDAERAAGIRSPSLGEQPSSVDTYSALAQLAEADQVKRSVQHRERRLGIKQLIEHSVYDIRTYWGESRQLAMPGEDDRVEASVFNATKIPPFFVIKVAKGAAKPRSQAEELKKIEEIWAAANTCGAVATNPDAWIKWFKDSLDSGQSLEIPAEQGTEQVEKAELENHFLTTGEREVVAAPYDPPEVHIPIHRAAQIEAELNEDVAAYDRITAHIQDHEDAAMEQQKILQMQQIAASHDAADMAQTAGDAHGRPIQPTEGPAPTQEPPK